MHELSIAQSIVELAWERAGERTVTRVIVEIGARAAVVPDALHFCFELACEGTPLAGAALEIIRLEGDELRIRAMEVT
jgi:hydrogenase nickel incorporation protein HypA/HybF